MKLTILLCLAALAFDGLEAGNTGRHKDGSCMQTTYVGKIHETNSRGQEECVGTFSGSNNFEQPSDCCWSSFAEKAKEILGGLVNILSSTSTCNPCGKRTCIDLDLKSRISKANPVLKCETHVPVVVQQPCKQVVYKTKTIDSCSDDCGTQAEIQPVLVKQPVYKQVVYKPSTIDSCTDNCEPTPTIQPVVVSQPVYQPVIEKVHVVPVKQDNCDSCDKHKCDDDCDHKHHKHRHHHHHHKHGKHHHKHDKCDDECD